MALLQALNDPNVAYFLVGDDWQAIYRFAGSDLALVYDCGVRLGHVQERTLSQTFRFADGILRPSTAFVQRNPEQTERPLRAASGAKDEGITVVADYNPRREWPVRYRRSRQTHGASVAPYWCWGATATTGMHYHRVEGTERCRWTSAPSTVRRGARRITGVVLYLEDDPRGFPCKIEDDPLLELVLPRLSRYPLAEERRLFYVAMTRARIGTYLVTAPKRPSEFVEELLQESGDDLRQLGELAIRCPRCARGRLLQSEGPWKLRCSNCNHPAPRCPNCNVGYALVSGHVAECSNQACEHHPTACPRCGIGILQEKDGGIYGPFWGCTEFWAEPPCRYTQDIEHGTSGTW